MCSSASIAVTEFPRTTTIPSGSSSPRSRASTVAAPPYGAHDAEAHTSAYRSGFAWSQHEFPGEHYKALRD